jgi:Cu/Ag efflux pump CusA
MNLSSPFIHRPVATTLLTIAIAIAGAIAFTVLPVSPLPQVDFPTISVSASLPGGSAEIMASSVATPLERQFGHIAGWRCAGRSGGDQCSAYLSACEPSGKSNLSQSESGRRADHDYRPYL